jgi:hypothetical protein
VRSAAGFAGPNPKFQSEALQDASRVGVTASVAGGTGP